MENKMEQQLQLGESHTDNKKHEYAHFAHSVGVMMLHLEWKPKYGYKMFRKEDQKNLASACIRRAASLHKIKIIVLSVMPEHIHAEVEVSLNMSASKAVMLLKGISANLFFRHNKKARLRYPKGHLWSRGKFASSVGFVQEEKVRNYILNQEEHHRETPLRTK
jgi:putative transposase